MGVILLLELVASILTRTLTLTLTLTQAPAAVPAVGVILLLELVASIPLAPSGGGADALVSTGDGAVAAVAMRLVRSPPHQPLGQPLSLERQPLFPSDLFLRPNPPRFSALGHCPRPWLCTLSLAPCASLSILHPAIAPFLTAGRTGAA